MDFERLLNHAKKNTEKSSREMAMTKNELSEKKTRELRRVQEEMERKKLEQRRKQQEAERALQRKQEEAKKQYQIPKVKKPEESTVSKDQILAFKAKKEEERIKTEKVRLKEKEKLAELRLEANGGRANKKIARHFGIDAINMQIRYGKDHEHIEKLQKRREKEQEEQDMLVDSFRGGVYKAMQQKKMVESSTTKNPPSGSRPVGTSKANSLAGMSSRHFNTKDRFSPPRNGKKAEPEKRPERPAVKRPAAPEIDFKQLMAIASEKAKAPINEKMPLTSKVTTKSGSGPSSKNPPQSHNNGHRYSEEIKKRPDHPDKSQSRKTIDHVPMKKPKMDHVDRREEVKTKASINGSLTKPMKDIVKSSHQNGMKASASTLPTPAPEPVIVSASKRYLPGDMRYKPDQEPFKAPQRPASISLASQKAKPESKHHDVSAKRPPNEKQRPKEKFSEPSRHDRDRDRHSAPMKRPEGFDRNERQKMEMKRRQTELERERQYRYESMSLLERERIREAERRKASMGYSRDDVDEWEDELEDDDYDSEMDDFIDDSMLDDDRTTRKELEETMRHINKNYDKNLWRKREQMIDERSMDTNYKQIDLEERRSRRLGLMEDVLEAKKGNSMAI